MRRHRSNKPSIALAMIARNEARCITRCLESVRPHVDKMVVLDTGSTDGTQLLAAGCGAEVHHLPWPDDFSAARNHVLAITDADWNLVLDADEWIASGGEALRDWCRQRRLGKVCVHSAMDGEGAQEAERRNWITRLLPRGVRYAGRVHEQPVSKLPRARIDLHLGHDGYLDSQLARKQGRNAPLLRRDLEERPGDPYLLYQLGKDAERDDPVEASRCYTAALAATEAGANWRHLLVVRALHALGKTGQFDAAVALAEAEMAHWPESPDFFFVLGSLLLEHVGDQRAQAPQWLPLAVSAFERCLEIGERPDLEGSMAGCGSHLAAHNLQTARTQLMLHAAQDELAKLVA